MNPLSVWTFYRRHKGHTALLLTIFIEPTRTNRQFLVAPKAGQKIVMDDWLEFELTQIPEIRVYTYGQSLINACKGTRAPLVGDTHRT